MTNDVGELRVDDAEVAVFVERYVTEQGLFTDRAAPITPQTKLEEAGLDSLATAELLLSARAELVEAGRLDPDATLLDLPVVTTVSDLGDLLRGLADQGGQ